MYGKVDERMNRDDGVPPAADVAWKRAEAEKDALRTAQQPRWQDLPLGVNDYATTPIVWEESQKLAVRLECLKIASSIFHSHGSNNIVDIAEAYAAFVLGEDDSAEIARDNDDLIERLSRIADECRNAGI